MLKRKEILLLSIGIITLAIGIFMSVILKQPHFYTPFSIGLFSLSWGIYNLLSKETLFSGWNFYNHLVFWILLVIASIVIDQIGLFLGYWQYPYYFTLSDEIIKILFEYAVSFGYFMIIVFIGAKFFEKIKINVTVSFLLSLLIFAPAGLIFTEYVNSFSNSWIVLMPKIIWFTVGAWLMVLVPFGIYKFINNFIRDSVGLKTQ